MSTALPTVVGELGGLNHLAWVVTAYLLAQTVVTPLYGKLGDLYGRKRIMRGAIVIFLIGSALCGMSRTMTQLIIYRAIQGLGGGGLTELRRGLAALASRELQRQFTRAMTFRSDACNVSSCRKRNRRSPTHRPGMAAIRGMRTECRALAKRASLPAWRSRSRLNPTNHATMR